MKINNYQDFVECQKAIYDYVSTLLPPDAPLTNFTVADVFHHYIGTREYSGIVKDIQQWYYGYVSETSWCATAMCWALAQLGLRQYTIDGKYDNVYDLYMSLEKSVIRQTCKKIKYIANLKYGDIVILCFDNEITKTANKHVTAFDSMYGNYRISCIGGNQSDAIKISDYDIKDIVGVYRPHYDKGTLKKLSDLPEG